MKINFFKYQGTGNDFVMIDNRDHTFPKNDTMLINRLCDRRFGIGADGLILLENDKNADFNMVYYNSDGRLSSMCGNGGRCIVAFAKQLGIISDQTTFNAVDGLHFASIDSNGIVSLQMKDVAEIRVEPGYVFLDTGSPHHVKIVSDVEEVDVKQQGSAIRYSKLYGETGSNVNFVQKIDSDNFDVRTYERGVEDETFACGTGVTAVAIAMRVLGQTQSSEVALNVKGGKLKVSFEENNGRFTNVFLTGPAEFVFKGIIE